MKIKIGLYLGCHPNEGGAFQYSLSILEAVNSLPKQMFESVICYTDKAWLEYLTKRKHVVFVPLDFFPSISARLWRHSRLPISWWQFISKYFNPITKALIKEHCNLWIFPSQEDWGYLAKVPSLVAIHDLMHRYERRFPEVSAHLKYYRREHHYRNICKWSKGILVDSVTGEKQVIESYSVNEKKIYILPFIAPSYVFTVKKNLDIKKKYKLPNKFIFYPAQFWEHKNHINLIKSIALLREEVPDLNLVLVGAKKNGYKSLIRLITKCQLRESIHFLGYVSNDDIVEIYRKARGMIFPSFFGPTNIPPLEAFALKCPVALADVYGAKEQAGDAALYFNPHSVKEIARCIKRLWIDDALCKKLIHKGTELLKERNQENFNQEFMSILNKILTIDYSYK